MTRRDRDGEPQQPARLPPRARGRTGDLFEHFGVNVPRSEPASVPGPRGDAPPRAARATACRGCGWIRTLAAPAVCRMCGYSEDES